MLGDDATAGLDFENHSRVDYEICSVGSKVMTVKRDFERDLPFNPEAGTLQQHYQRVFVDSLQKSKPQFRMNRIKSTKNCVVFR